jgi:hypothetical protein
MPAVANRSLKLPFKGDAVYSLLGLVLILLPTLLTLVKRMMLAALGMAGGARAWSFSLISSLAFWLIPLGG